MSTSRRLTRADIVEITGIVALDTLEDLEILFSTCDEIDSLEECINLKRLSMIDNGLRTISNLWPVGGSLRSLCLCDQSITVMANLDLPNLQELFLHRNSISKIAGLHGCPRLKKLWLCQNSITELFGLHAVPELEELFVQSNQISFLGGLESNLQLQRLGLAGNLLTDFEELSKLTALPKLTELSLSDIHFGRCPLVDDRGYKDFIVSYFPQVRLLDGVSIPREVSQAAEATYISQLKQFEEAIRSIEDEFRQDMQKIDSQLQSRQSHSSVLEQEMGAALNELQSLVSEGRAIMLKQTKKQESLLDRNMRTLAKTLEISANKAKTVLNAALLTSLEEQDLAGSYFCTLERLAHAEMSLVNVLSNASAAAGSSSAAVKKSPRKTEAGAGSPHKQFLFQALNAISPDYLHMRSLLTRGAPGDSPLELVHMYRVYSSLDSHRMGPSAASHNDAAQGSDIRVFIVLEIDKFAAVFRDSTAWTHGGSNVVLSTHAETAIALGETIVGNSFQYDFLEEMQQQSADGAVDLTSSPKLQTALQNRILLVLSCWLDCGAIGLRLPVNDVAASPKKMPKLNLPRDGKARSKIMSDLCEASGLVVAMLDVPADSALDSGSLSARRAAGNAGKAAAVSSADGSAGSHWVLSIPASRLGCIGGSTGSAGIRLETACICLKHARNDRELSASGTVKDLETKLDMLLLPAVSSDRVSGVLSSFENEVSASVKSFVDHVLEEVDNEASSPMRQAEAAFSKQEASLRHLRDAVEKERRGQDGQLRELRQLAAEAPVAAASTTTHKPNAGASSKRR